MTNIIAYDDDYHRILFDMAADCLLILDMNGYIIDINVSGLTQRGYSLEEMVGKRISEFDPPEFACRVPERMERLFRDGRACFESAHIRKDGSVMPVEINSRVIKIHGDTFVLSVIRDITERKQHEFALHCSHKDVVLAHKTLDDERAVLKAILDNSPTGLHLYELNSTGQLIFIGANPASDRILSVDNKQFIGRSIEDAFPALRVTEIPSQYKRIAQEGGSWSSEQISYHEGKIHGAFEVIAYQVAPGRMVASFDDITLRKCNEESLRNSEELWHFALEGAGDGVWDWQVQTGFTYFSKRWKEMLGYSEFEFEGDFDEWQLHLHPEDKLHITSALDAYFSKTISEYVQEFRMLCKDGSWKWILARGMVTEWDHEGKPLRMIGTHSDISRQKLIEKELADSKLAFQTKSALLQSVLDNAPLWIWYLGANGQIQFVNKTFSSALGISEQQFLTTPNYADLLPVDTAESWIQTDHACLTRDEPQLSKELIKLIDGQDHFLEITKIRLTDLLGETVGLIALAQDITERELNAEALRLAGLVYQNTSEAIAITDENNNIVAINPAFTLTTGYALDEVIGKNPNILSSGRQSASFYHAMWQDLNSTGCWHGEIWNRRKNGEVFAEQMSINTIFNSDGTVYRRIALFLDVTERKSSEEIIWRQANFDVLTGLPNRRMFRDRLSQEIKKAHRIGETFALLFIDLDQFKGINDTLGHHVGDELLVQAAARLSACVRETDSVARLGGDEFTVILTELQKIEDIDLLTQKIVDKLAEPYQLGIEVVRATASVGITVYPDDATQLDQLLKNADQAMYVAKEEGRNRFSYFTSSLQEAAMLRLSLIRELNVAMKDHQFRVYFQPIVELSSGKIFKAEALLRWQHPQRGLVSPMTFIPVAEETGLIIPIGEWVFRESARYAKRWGEICEHGYFQISVNKSPVQFRAKDASPESWFEYMTEIGLSGRSIAIEITEGLLLNRDDHTSRKLLQFRDHGVQVSIDDFGTGYSALSYLKKFDIDYLKIDQSFVRNMVEDSADQALCEAIVVMAHKLGLKVIAEGVETTEQRDLLLQIGCDFGQGYLFAKPMPGEEFESMLKFS